MKQLKAAFWRGAVSMETLPEHPFPEIAFVGRSNVGKSSLLNSLVLLKNLAHVSQTPGKTQQINFYPIESKWMFVDLPGYGYAKVSREEREKWQNFNNSFLLKSPQLALVCILVDSRHDPMPSDLALIELMENAQRPYVVVLTKTDKLKPTVMNERHEQLKQLVQYCNFCVDVLPYSVEVRRGRDELWGVIKRLAAQFSERISQNTNTEPTAENSNDSIRATQMNGER
ncbi:MAG: YihA family ribosome biogenesis GTP-binding protein [Candidatus Kapabacteria bacterium]|nr:YihA family ribosome biogenesis GTP-binding protein [Candidatus Kapabacteria bacterium]